MKGLIHCDTCHHEQHEDDIASWHGKPCPKCGAPEIINDEDYAYLLMFQVLIDSGFATQEPPTGPSLSLKISTAGLRK